MSHSILSQSISILTRRAPAIFFMVLSLYVIIYAAQTMLAILVPSPQELTLDGKLPVGTQWLEVWGNRMEILDHSLQPLSFFFILTMITTALYMMISAQHKTFELTHDISHLRSQIRRINIFRVLLAINWMAVLCLGWVILQDGAQILSWVQNGWMSEQLYTGIVVCDGFLKTLL